MSVENGFSAKRIWAISLPVMFAELSETIVHAIDTIFLGHVGNAELAALVLADTILGLLVVFVIGLSDAMQIVIARRAGEDRLQDVSTVFKQGLFITLVMSFALTIGIKLVASPLSEIATESNDVASALNDYLQIVAYGLPFFCASVAYSSFYIGISRTRVLVTATAVLAATNFILGYALILGNLGLPRLGMRGAALASLGAEVATAVFLIVWTARRSGPLSFRLFEMPNWDPAIVRMLFGLATPVAIYGVVEGFQWLFYFVIIEQVSVAALAWSNIIYTCLLIFLIPVEAVSEVVVSLTSRVIGAERRDRIAHVTRRAVALAGIVTLPLAAIALVMPELVFSGFGVGDPAGGALNALRVVALGMAVAVPAMTWSGALQGTGDTAAVSAIESIVAVVAVGWALVAALVVQASLVYIWLSLPVSWLLGLTLSYSWMRSGHWETRAELL